ncbi:MAG TPA: glycosyltransferase family 4 protein [Actinomycetota bacterium]|nr:glycosyltransferase family 4 protein [Actinomycetota bacterium]
MTHLLVTNDFPPKVGGIQTYLWELWRRLPPGSFTVLTGSHPGAAAFDESQPYRIDRIAAPVLLPTPALRRRVVELAAETGARFLVVDPVLPLGLAALGLGPPFALVGHGAEITVPGRLPGSRAALGRVVRAAIGSVAAGGYVADELRRAAGVAIDVAVVPPGVDAQRFRPIEGVAEARRSFGLPEAGPLVVNVGRLVPRKGVDVLIGAAARLRRSFPELTLAVAGTGRDRERLERLARRRGAPVRFLGKVPDDRLPALYGCADVFAAPNRSRWFGLEQEGFGIVFLEAAACGVPQVAGRSGGAPEAVRDNETGLLVDDPSDDRQVAGALGQLLDDPAARARMGEAARRRAGAEFSYDVLAARLRAYLAELAARVGQG